MKNRSLFSKLFLLLIIFITVPVIIIASMISYEMTKYSEEEISKSEISKLKASDRLTSFMADNLRQRALEMTIGSSMNDLSGVNQYKEVFTNPEGIMKLYNVQNQLNNLVSASSSIHSVYLYIDNTDYILTSNQAVQHISEFGDTGWMPSYERFKNTHSGSSWISTRTVRYSKNTKGELGASNKVITFFYTFTPYTTNVKGVLVFNIYEPSFREMINGDKSFSEGYIQVINTNGDIISDIQDGMIGKNVRNTSYINQILKNSSPEGYLIDNSNDKRLLITYYKSEYNNWIYLGIYKANDLLAKAAKLKTFTLYICFSLIVIGILISYFASKRIYNPLNNLLQDIRKKKGIDIKSNESDMSILSKAFDNLMKDQEKLSAIIENKDSNKNIYLTNLLKGKNDKYFDTELTGINFSFNSYICSIILIDRFKDFETVYSKEQQDYMRVFILKISEELFGPELKCAGIIYEKKRLALIINFDDQSGLDIRKTLENIFIQIQNEVRKIMDNMISIGIGNCQNGTEGIGDSFDKAQEALRYKLINGYGSINFWDDIYNESTEYFYPFAHETHIFNILNAGIKDRLDEEISQMIQEIKDYREIHYDNVIQIFNQLIGNTIKYLLDAHCNVSMIFGNNYNIYKELSSKETLDDVEGWLIGIYSRIADYMARMKDESKDYLELALDYINKNYMKDINIDEIAEYAGISYSHLRKIFKDETGENLVNYVNGLRIRESKRLLRMTNMTIREISAALGYNSDQSFVRFFKKYEGIAPGEFRLSNKQKIPGP